MNLQLFDIMIEHIARICRAITTPKGHILLVGTGGQSRKSLAALACFIAFQKPMLELDSQSPVEGLKNALKMVGLEEKDQVLLYEEAQTAIP